MSQRLLLSPSGIRPGVFSILLCLLPAILVRADPLPPARAIENRHLLLQRYRHLDRASELRGQGKIPEAISETEKALAIESKTLGDGHEEVVGTALRLAGYHADRDAFAAARTIAEATRASLIRRHGAKHPRTRDVRCFLETLARQERLTRPERQQLAEANALLARVDLLYAAEKKAEALPLAERAATLTRDVVGADSLDHAAALEWLAELRAGEEPTAAEKLTRQVLSIRARALGEDHPSHTFSLKQLREICDQLVGWHVVKGDFAAAKRAAQETLALATRLHGAGHWQTTNARLELQSLERRAALTDEQRRRLAALDERLDELFKQMAEQRQRPAGPRTRALTREAFLEALDERKQLIGAEDWSHAMHLEHLAEVCDLLKDRAEADRFSGQALDLHRRLLGSEHPRLGELLHKWGRVALKHEDRAGAEKLARQSLQVLKKAVPAGDRALLPALDLLGQLCESQNKDAEAERLYREAFEIHTEKPRDKPKDQAAYLMTLTSLSRLYENRDNFAQALPLLREAVDGSRALFGAENTSYALLLADLGDLYRQMGDYPQAEPLLTEALALSRRVPKATAGDQVRALLMLGRLHYSNHKPDAALQVLDEALALARKNPDDPNIDRGPILQKLATIYRERSQIARAEPLYREVLDLAREKEGPELLRYASALHGMAHFLDSTGESVRARELLRQSLAIKENQLGSEHTSYRAGLTDLAAVHEILGENPQAETMLREVLRGTRRVLDLNRAAGSERLQLALAGRYRSTLENYLSLVVRAKLPAGPAYEEVLTWKGAVFARQLRLRQEHAHPEAADDLRQLRDVSARLVGLLQAGPQPRKRDEWKRQVDELAREKDRIEGRVAGRVPPVEGRPGLEEVQRALPPGSVLIDFLEHEHRLPPRGGKGEWDYEWRVLAFVVHRDRPVVVIDLGERRPITDAVQSWRRQLTEPAGARRPEKEDLAAEVRRLVWQPLEAKLGGARTILVSPDGVLARCPLGALPGSKPGSYLLEDYLIAAAPVPAMLPEWRFGRGATRAAPPAPSLLVLADVDFDASPGRPLPAAAGYPDEGRVALRGDKPQVYRPLPATGPEAEAVAGAFGKAWPEGAVTRLGKDQATQTSLRELAPGKRYLHLATHGFFSPVPKREMLHRRMPMPEGRRMVYRSMPYFVGPSFEEEVAGVHPGVLSGLALAGANRGVRRGPDGAPLTADGIWTALEVAELDLRGTELVVLSACETGLGEVVGGEGLQGLQRAFQVAGAECVVASLWKVDDEATRLLMELFYDNLWNKRLGKLEALRQAQLSLLNGATTGGRAGRGFGAAEPDSATGRPGGRTHPRFWAAWVHSGDPGTLDPISEGRDQKSEAESQDPAEELLPPWAGGSGLLLPVLGGTVLVIASAGAWFWFRHRRAP